MRSSRSKKRGRPPKPANSDTRYTYSTRISRDPEEEDDEEEADITYELVMSANEATLDQIAGMVEGFDKAPFKGQPKKYRKAIIAALELTPAG